MHNRLPIIVSGCCIGLYLLSCSAPDAGNGTLTSNPVISGRVFQPDGVTPAKNAAVYLRTKNTLLDISSIGGIPDIPVTQTDNNGYFGIDSAADGTYTIECTDGNNNYALFDSVTVAGNQVPVSLHADTLKPAGAIKGTIHLSSGGDPEKVYVLAFDVERFTIAVLSGDFKLKSLPEGTYSLRFLSSMAEYGTYDTADISVVSGDTTNIGTIELPYVALPPIKNVTLNLDTMKQIVTVVWDSIDASRINGYNVYKRSPTDSIFNKVNKSLLQHPFYRDSAVVNNTPYLYRICTLNADSTEGVKSQPCSVTVINNHLKFVSESNTSIKVNRQEGKRILQKTMILSSTNFLYVVSDSFVIKYDTNFTEIDTIKHDSLKNPYEIAPGNNGRVYVSDRTKTYTGELRRIVVFNDDGSLHKIIPLYESDTSGTISGLGIKATLFSVNNKEQLAIVTITRDTVYMYDTSGALLRSIGGFGDGGGAKNGAAQVQFDSMDNVYITDFEVGLKVYDSILTFKTMVHFTGYDFPEFQQPGVTVPLDMILTVYGVYIDHISNLILIYHDFGMMYAFTLDGQFVLKTQIGAPVMARNRNNLFVALGDKVQKYSFDLP